MKKLLYTSKAHFHLKHISSASSMCAPNEVARKIFLTLQNTLTVFWTGLQKTAVGLTLHVEYRGIYSGSALTLPSSSYEQFTPTNAIGRKGKVVQGKERSKLLKGGPKRSRGTCPESLTPPLQNKRNQLSHKRIFNRDVFVLGSATKIRPRAGSIATFAAVSEASSPARRKAKI
jgi:hypothetical protein